MSDMTKEKKRKQGFTKTIAKKRNIYKTRFNITISLKNICAADHGMIYGCIWMQYHEDNSKERWHMEGLMN